MPGRMREFWNNIHKQGAGFIAFDRDHGSDSPELFKYLEGKSKYGCRNEENEERNVELTIR